MSALKWAWAIIGDPRLMLVNGGASLGWAVDYALEGRALLAGLGVVVGLWSIFIGIDGLSLRQRQD